MIGAPGKEGILTFEVDKLLDVSPEYRVVTQFFDYFFLSLKKTQHKFEFKFVLIYALIFV